MSRYDWDQGDDLDEDEKELEDKEFGGKDAIVFLIDARSAMHEMLDEDSDDGFSGSAFQKALSCAHATLKKKIFGSASDLIGVIAFGTKKKLPASLDFDNLAEILPIKPPCGESILLLETLMDVEIGNDRFEEDFGVGDKVALHEALWQCQSLLSSVQGKVGSKTILLMTCNDNPHDGDTRLDGQVRRKAVDLHETNIFLDIIPIVKQDKDFNMDLIYRDLIKLADDDNAQTYDHGQKLEDLTKVVLQKTHKKRSFGKMNLSLGGGVNMGVSIFNLLSKTSKPAKTKLARDTNEEVISQRTWVHPVSGAPLLPSDINQFMDYGMKNIKLTSDEAKNLKQLGEGGADSRGLKLLGFKPKSCLKFGHFVKSSQFLYPDEKTIKGSRNMFTALLLRCLAKDVVALCRYKARLTSDPTFVALVPQAEELDDSGSQVAAPGFHAVFLPFIDDVRQAPENLFLPESDPDAVEAAKNVMAKLRLKKFIPVENPDLQNHYQLIEAHGLHRDSLVKPEDETLPDHDRMSRKLGDKSKLFLETVYPAGYDPEAPVKKAAKKSSPTPKAPKIKQEAGDIDMAKEVKNNTIGKLTVDVLKTWCKGQGIGVSNKKKAELLELIKEHV